VTHTWEPPPPEPPWIITAAPKGLGILAATLILLPLFLFRPNRCPAAWWIWLPVVISVPAGMAITCLITGVEWSLAQAVGAFIIGLAAMWLLMPHLKSRYRIVTFFKALAVLAAFSLLAAVPALPAAQNGWIDFRLYLVILLALASLAATFALTFGGFSVRHRFGRIRFLAWLAVWTAVAWVVIASPFMVVGAVNGDIEWGPSLVAILWAVGSSLALLLPLLLLSFFQPFYRARFFGFLKVPQTGPPAGAAVPPKLPGIYQPEGATAAVGTVK
jgi:peptidoglycan/LPS O-acetylase OafA/YrhL